MALFMGGYTYSAAGYLHRLAYEATDPGQGIHVAAPSVGSVLLLLRRPIGLLSIGVCVCYRLLTADGNM